MSTTSLLPWRTLAHATIEEAYKEILKYDPSGASGRVQWINVWKPLKGPLNDWPLALCDTLNLVPKVDFETMDLLYPDLVTENTQIYFDPKYRWWYLSDHEPSELLVFLQADLLGADPSPGVPHSAFQNPLTRSNEDPRESIELRLLVYYD